MKMLEQLEKKLGYTFKDKSLLEKALTHVSYSKKEHYETLEFLGNALVNFFIVDLLVQYSPNKREGFLSPLKAYLISEEFFNLLAQKLELHKFIRIKRGKINETIIGDVFEALWAAVYIDSGRDANFTRELFYKLFKEDILSAIKEGRVKKDYKTILQEITQKRWKERPEYRLISVEGPHHKKKFIVEAKIKEYRTLGEGKSKKEAEQRAAEELIKLLEESE
uniref:Ribonuclease III n=1 Tax=Aquifex aeolicus TaxID=63363 RepID=UPI000069645F|nr:Chain A, Ribonuclease III [Aquifex aeolicus]2EZ6_B Chain B, Ribonuclease III [Aquifex aeolicus]